MRKSTAFLLPFLLIAALTTAQSAAPDDTTRYEIDIANIKDDMVKVTINPAANMADSAIYNMPKIVPGTYSISDFGRFVDSLRAFDAGGELLEVKKLDTNRWLIPASAKMKALTYWVNDTFDEAGSGIFEPGGSNIEQGSNIVLNPFGFVGYFSGQKEFAAKLDIIKPEDFYGETSLRNTANPEGRSFRGGRLFPIAR